MEHSWILVGMMGAGKSAVGRALAAISGRAFVDTDQLLQNRFGRPVGQIFRQYGEEAFRAHETSILRSLEPARQVISTGGGIVLLEANWIEMRRLGVTIYLRAPADALMMRLEASKKKRPLLEGDDWRDTFADIMSRRQPMYEKADMIVDVAALGIGEVAASIFDRVKEYSDRSSS